ncbi:MAG: ATP-binding protein, partial [Thermosynechococcaceae cyanobacterium]
IQDQAARAEAENASKDEFLSMLSHELRTPLNSMLGWLHILIHQSPDPILLRRGLQVIDRSAQAQIRLIKELIDTSLIVQNRLQLEMEAVDLTQLLQDVIDVMLPLADRKQLHIQATLADSPGYFIFDPDRIQQVIWNLISNSIKFTSEVGLISLELTYETHQAQIVVNDMGEGISPEILPHIFERFKQGDSATTRQHGGLGLGLAIAKYLVEAHNGTIVAESPGVGQGTIFQVTLPLTAASAPPEKPQLDTAVMTLAGFNLLIVDDDQDNLDILEMLFADVHDATVVTADSVTQAITQFLEQPPDLLISDISMPGRDGFELIQWVRSLPPEQGGAVNAIAVTGHASDSDAQRLIAAGFQAHIAKPVQFDELLDIVMRLMHK